MNMRHHAVTLGLAFAIALSAAACSKKEPEKTAAQEPPAAQAPGPQDAASWQTAGSLLSTDSAIAYRKHCAAGDGDARECEILRSLVVVEVTMALEEIERSRDQRGAAEALAALDLADEPEIIIAACRVLGQFPGTPAIAEKVLPYMLESPYVEVQRAAAQLLSRNPDPGLADIGVLWTNNHSALAVATDHEDYPDFPEHFAGMGFPEYPGAEWFSPADSDRSIGWSTTDDPATVSRWFSEALHAEAQGAEEWMQAQGQQAALWFKSMDQSKVLRMQQLSEKFVKTQDAAAMAELEKLQKEIDAAAQDANAAIEKGVDKVALPPSSSFGHEARWIVAQEKAGHLSRVVLVYRLPGLQRTVIQLAWNLGDYPSAWPKAKDSEG